MDKTEVEPLYDEAVKIALEVGYVGVANLQRRMKIGYVRASHLVDFMVDKGFCEVDPDGITGRRAIIAVSDGAVGDG